MSRLSSFALALGVIAVGASSAGCVSRELVAFADHPSKPLTALNVSVDRSYVFWSTSEYVFYSCSERAEELVCKRLCGGDTDVECPKAIGTGEGATTNIE